MYTKQCRNCGIRFDASASQCPNCDAIARQGNSATSSAKPRTDSSTNEQKVSEVSGLNLFLFGFFYLYYKGWRKAGAVHMFLCFFLMGTFWIVIPLYATKFVNTIEDL